jgi:hypothetical protein
MIKDVSIHWGVAFDFFSLRGVEVLDGVGSSQVNRSQKPDEQGPRWDGKKRDQAEELPKGFEFLNREVNEFELVRVSRQNTDPLWRG